MCSVKVKVTNDIEADPRLIITACPVLLKWTYSEDGKLAYFLIIQVLSFKENEKYV